jgi:hypothetical protein
MVATDEHLPVYSAELVALFENRCRQVALMRDHAGRRFTKREVVRLAESPDVDVHRLRDLLEAGASLDQARAIVL